MKGQPFSGAERAYIEQKTPYESLSGDEITLHETYENRLRSSFGKLRTSEDDFKDIYDSHNDIAADKKKVKEIETDWEDSHQRAEFLTQFVAVEGSRHGAGFFGNAEITPASKYDDTINNTDLVVEIQQADGKNIIFGIDVTTSSGAALDKKTARQEQKLLSGELSSIKYYQSPFIKQKRGMLANLPVVLVGVSRENLQGNAYEMNKASKNPQGMKGHPLGNLFRQEVLSQLDGQIQFMEQAMPRRTPQQEQALQILRNTRESIIATWTSFSSPKQKAEMNVSPLTRDPTYQYLVSPLRQK